MEINTYGFGINGLDMVIKLSNNIPTNKVLIVEYYISTKEFKCGKYINKNMCTHIFSKKKAVICIDKPITQQQVLDKLFMAMKPNAKPKFLNRKNKQPIIDRLKQPSLFIIHNSNIRDVYQTKTGKRFSGGYKYYTVEMKDLTLNNIQEACNTQGTQILSVVKNDIKYKCDNFRLIKGQESVEQYLKKISKLRYADTKEFINANKLLNTIIDGAVDIKDDKIIIAQKNNVS